MSTDRDNPSHAEAADDPRLSKEFTRLMTRELFKHMYDEEREYFKDFFEHRIRAANYLLIAHAGAFVGCIGALRDFKDTSYLKGIGIFILLFAAGFSIASLGFIGLLIAKNEIMTAIIDGAASRSPDKKQISLTYTALFLSYTLLIIGVMGIAVRLSGLLS